MEHKHHILKKKREEKNIKRNKEIAWSRNRTWVFSSFCCHSVEVDLFAQGVKGHPDVFAVYILYNRRVPNPRPSVGMFFFVVEGKMCYHYTNLASHCWRDVNLLLLI